MASDDAPRKVLTKDDLLLPVPTLESTPVEGRQALMIHKLQLCQVLFDFPPPGPNAAVAEKHPGADKKQEIVAELTDFIVVYTSPLDTPPVLAETINMLSVNLFRALPPKVNTSMSGEDDETVLYPSWVHLQVVYEFLLRFIVSDVEFKLLKKYVTKQFVVKLLQNFDSEDGREQDYLKTILHRIYAKFMGLRAFIRKAIANVFQEFLVTPRRRNGIAELLEVLGSIVIGYATPLKEEHRAFLLKMLLPLHKAPILAPLHNQLSYCVTQFVDKDPKLAIPVISALLKYWPHTNSHKAVLFLNELEEVLELTGPEDYEQIMVPLFSVIAKAMGSSHFQVAERALCLFHNEYISGVMAELRVKVFPILFPILQQNSKNHWNATVTGMTLNVLKLFSDLDPPLVERCRVQLQDEQQKQKEKMLSQQRRWTVLKT